MVERNVGFDNLGKVLELIRKRNGMTQAEFGRVLGWDERTVRRYVRGELNARLDVVRVKAFFKLLAEAGMSLDDLPDPPP
ncbi:helix-turn-helix transcriptional regulator [Coleofasciculus sp.]|uniref:helix-turn-helix transcriptional regulator n=1 Tax=Coleofasciculus sp. TaxID=3100458 RepID=UPI0039FA1B66